jgi:hypothetical protein
MKLQLALQLAGLIQVLLLTAGASMTRVVRMPEHLRTLPIFLRQLFWTYFGFIGFVLLSLGVVTLANSAELAAANGLARWFNGFACLFWTARLGVQCFVFDLRPFLTNGWLRAGHAALNVAFLYLPIVYGWAAFHGGGTQ